MNLICRFGVVFLSCVLSITNATAAPVNWSVDAFLDSPDGTLQERLTGTFTYDGGIFSNANLTLTDLNSVELFRYEFASNRQGYVGYQYIGDFFESDPTEDLTGVSFIAIGFNLSGLLDYTNAIGSFPITDSQTDPNFIVKASRQTCLNASLNSTTCQLSTHVITASTSGTLSTVPIPSQDTFPWELFMPAIFSQKPSSPVCQDNDGDGYGNPAIPACPNSGLDCNDNDSSIYPGAPEACGDGIDQDCNGEDLSCALNCTGFPPPPGETHTFKLVNSPITFSTTTQSVNETVGGYTVYRIWGTEDPPGLGLYIGCDNQLGEVDVATDWWDISDPSNNGKSFWQPPIFYCQIGEPVGTTCNWTGTFDGSPEQQVMQVVGYEQVTVPYGTFPNSMKARITTNSDGDNSDDYYWGHPDVGIIKVQGITDGITLVLTDYQSPSGANSLNTVRSSSAVTARSSSAVLRQILEFKRRMASTSATNIDP